jgi:hypothetical protein
MFRCSIICDGSFHDSGWRNDSICKVENSAA